jgi:hypothetical protein
MLMSLRIAHAHGRNARLGPIALALVRREAEPGAAVAVGEDGTAEVVELPF